MSSFYKNMRVLIINSNFFGKDGITAVIKNLFRYMNKSGMIIDFVTINNPDIDFISEVEASGGRIFVIPRRFKCLGKYFRNLKRIIKERQYDLVHVHGNSSTLVIEMLAAYFAGCKIRIAHSHNTTCKSKLLHKLMGPLFRKLCTHAFACGEEAGKWMFGEKRRFSVIKNGIDLEKYRFNKESRRIIREKYELADDINIIGHVGFFCEQKNQIFLIDVFSKYLSVDPNAVLMFIGQGNMLGSAKKRCEELSISKNVIFVGIVDNAEDYYSAFDCFVMPSIYEGLPLSAIEAQTSGLKCFLSNKISKEVDKTSSTVFLPIDSHDRWVNALKDYFNSKADVRSIKSEGAISAMVSQGYSIVNEAETVRSLYYSFLNERLSQ